MSEENNLNRIPPSEAAWLVAAHDGNVAMLYIWQSLHPAFDAEKAAADLCLTVRDVLSAKEILDRMPSSAPASVPAASVSAREILPPPDTLPEYTASDVKRMLGTSGEFPTLVQETSRMLGHMLSTPDQITLLGIYDYLAIPADVIMELIHFCSERSQEKYGTDRRLSMLTIQKEAFLWAKEGILTFEAAEEYISRQKTMKKDLADMAEALNLSGRKLTASQEKYIRSWIEMGFGKESVAEAYDRTVMNTGDLKWSYMDKILQNWHGKGLHSIREIREKDQSPFRKSKPQRNSNVISPDDIINFVKDNHQ